MQRPGTLALWTLLAVLAWSELGICEAATRHGSWVSFTDRADGREPCFIAASPLAREPRGPRRDPAFAYVTLLPSHGIAGEISFKLGFPLRHGSQVVVAIGVAQIKLFVLGERAFVVTREEETRMLEAMRKGSRMVVTAISDRGAVTRDSYSLAGMAQALQAATAACP